MKNTIGFIYTPNKTNNTLKLPSNQVCKLLSVNELVGYNTKPHSNTTNQIPDIILIIE